MVRATVIFLFLLGFAKSIDAQDFAKCYEKVDRLGDSTGFSLPVEYFDQHPACDGDVDYLIFKKESNGEYTTFYRGNDCHYLSSEISQSSNQKTVYKPINWCEVNEQNKIIWDLSNVLIDQPIKLK